MTFATIQGGAGEIPEPDWSLLFSDELDLALAREQWGVLVRELRDNEKLASVNAHQVKRLVVSYVMFEVAARHVAQEGAVFPRKGRRQPAWNPWWSVLKDANTMASSAEAELTVSPRRRNAGGKVKAGRKRSIAAEEHGFLKPVRPAG